MSDKVLDLVNKINDGEWYEIEPYIGSMENAINLITKHGYLHLIDPFNDDLEDIRNSIIYEMLNNHDTSDELFKKIVDRLSDIDFINGEYYVNLSDLTDLSELFYHSSRDTSPRDVAKAVLGEDYWEPFWNTTDNVYTDVIEELTPDNKKYFRDKVLKLLENKEIELDGRSSDLMEELAGEQNKETSFIVTPQNIDRIINDEDTMLWLLKNELHDLNSDLYNVHSNAYNGAYNDEYYRKVWSELGEYIDTDSKPDWFKWGKGNRVRIRVRPGDLFRVIKDFFYEYKGYTDDIDNYGSYIDLVRHMMDTTYDYLDFRMNDYPDGTEVDKRINEYFGDYI